MSTLIIFKSVFHATEQYARWLGEELGVEVLAMKRVKDLSQYSRLIIMSGTYAGSMPLTAFLKKHWQALQGKELIAVAVGAAPPDDPMSTQSYERIPAEIRAGIHFMKIPGATPFANKEKRASEVLRTHLNPVLDYLRQT